MNEPSQDRIEAIGDQLRDKISSKFQISAFLGGFAFTVLSIQLTLLWDSNDIPQYLPHSIACMIGAIGLFLAALVTLDRLTMPKRFWKEDKSKQDHATDATRLFARNGYLEKNDLWTLRNRMVFYWVGLDYIGIGFVLLSLMFLLSKAVSIDAGQRLTRNALLEQTACMGIWVVLIVVIYIATLWAVGKYVRKFPSLFRGPD
jgi:hypothetical protein